MQIDKKILNFLVIILLSFITFWWTFFIYHMPFEIEIVASVIVIRMLASRFILRDYSLSWSKASQKTFLIKSVVYITAFFVYLPVFYGKVRFSFLVSELFLYLFSINFLMYAYYYFTNKSKIKKTKSVVIYGAGKAGIKLASELHDSKYKIEYFVDDDKTLHNRSVDSVNILSEQQLKRVMKDKKYDLLVIAMPSVPKERIKTIYDSLSNYFEIIQVLPSLDEILTGKNLAIQLRDLSVEDLLARHPKDLDKEKIKVFIKDKTVLVTGAGGSIGSEICRQCEKYGAKKLILLDHSEYNLYAILEEIQNVDAVAVMQSVVNRDLLEEIFQKHKPQVVIHAAAYKHVPLVESNIYEGIVNNVMGTKNVIDTSIKYGVEKFVMISTDKAVRPTNVMGTTKRICELYAQNSNGQGTDIVAVRFGNVLGSSGSVIPKFKKQIENGGPVTVTHPDITRYFMLIPEACELVLQAGAIGSGGEIFILDMGEPIKIVDLAKKMIDLSGRENIDIVYTGLRPGEKLYEELLIDESDTKTEYESITVAKPTPYNLKKLNEDIEVLLTCNDRLGKLKEIVPEFNHQKNN
ncbi:polysaccharide biosynthesis protein [Sulfurimonas sediminis]|uniref:Polysaccharide biosynthesis protein n=1 Tax=Sulfurimonas sediminis TaxID=2590020 RepID=A0A7M1B0S7_9BACT|nr:nucleoside-diphosphate sugar epimerase/dehydratase [Sulfurimonas sediminis]QOP43245.1 polysaccharide biosynthesis protein [Sulfurimonas sediminis]